MPWWSVAANRCQFFKQIDGQVKNTRRNCFYFAMMICCCWWISVLQGNLGPGRERKEKIFLLCDDELLLLIDVRPLSKLMDRSRTDRGNVSTLRWWSVAADASPSFKQIDGQVENRRRNCLYFAMMICCSWWISVLQEHLRTGRELKEKMFLLCDDDMLLQTDLSPLTKLNEFSITKRSVCFYFVMICWWWSISVLSLNLASAS